MTVEPRREMSVSITKWRGVALATGGALAIVACVGDAANAGPDAAPDAPITDAGNDTLDAGMDAPTDAADAATACNVASPFGAPSLVAGEINNGEADGFWLLPDELTVYISTTRSVSLGAPLFGTRAKPDAPFVSLTSSASLSSVTGGFGQPTLTADGNTIYFSSGAAGAYDVWVATRSSTSVDFDPPKLAAAPINVNGGGAGEDVPTWISPDGSTLYLISNRAGSASRDVWVATRAGSGPFADPVPLASVNSAGADQTIILTSDELQAFTTRGTDIYYTSRAKKTDGFTPPVIVPELNRPGTRGDPLWLSPDGCTLYFNSNRGDAGFNNYHVYVASRGK